MSATDNNQINQLQAALKELARVNGERTRATREMGVPQPAASGYTGDIDQRRMMTQALQGQILIQRGMNGWQAGDLTINQAPTVYKPNLPILTNNCGPSLWHQTRVTPGVVPFLQPTPFVPSCGQTFPQYNGGTPPIIQQPVVPSPVQGFDVPSHWPGPFW